MNKVILIGNLGKDVETRYAPSGTAIATFSMATAERKKVDGEWVKSSEWHNILAFGKTAEVAGEYLSKGSKVAIEGRLQSSSWEDQQGVKKYKTEVVVDQLEFLESKNSGKPCISPTPESEAEGEF